MLAGRIQCFHDGCCGVSDLLCADDEVAVRGAVFSILSDCIQAFSDGKGLRIAHIEELIENRFGVRGEIIREGFVALV